MRQRFLAALFLSAVAGSVCADWPQWRGPNRDNRVADARLPEKWPDQAPEPLWQKEVGEGYSSPVIAGGKLYIMARQDKDKEVCLCLDAQTGETIWDHAYDAPYKPHPAARSAGSGPKSTITIDGDRIYCLGIAGMFHCLDAKNGKSLWKHDFQNEYWGVDRDDDGYDTWATYCGASCSPLVVDGYVVVSVGGKKAGAFAAFDRRTGEIAWKALEDRASYASPIVAEPAGVRQVIGFTGLRMVGLNPQNGKLFWEHPVKVAYEQTIVTPVVWKDHVIVCAESTPTVALKIDKKDGKPVMSEAWRNKDLKSYMATPTIAGDALYGLDESGRLVCINLADGKTRWSDGRFGQYVCILAAGKQLLVLGAGGELTVVAADPKEYKQLARLRLSKAGETWANPALLGSKLYIKDKQHLLCFDFAR